MIEIIAAALAGYVAHESRRIIKQNTSSVGWQLLISYVIGVLLVLAFGGAIYERTTGRPAREFILPGLGAACAVGSGVGGAWLLQGDSE